MNKKSWNRTVLEILGERPIAFIPLLAKISGSVGAGLFMSQMLYWWGKGKNKGWVYKTIEEFKKETYLNRSEQDSAIRAWVGLGVLEKKLKGIPPRRFFRIDMDGFLKLIDEATLIAEPDNTNCENELNDT